MKIFLSIMAAGILVCSVCGCVGQQNNVIKPDKGLPSTTPWDLKELSEPPNFQWADREDEVWSLYYQGPKYKGKSTRVFAYYSNPAILNGEPAEKGSFPAVVLVHGGGGMAFKAWAKLWAQRGYAAISMDLAGCGPKKRVRLDDGGPSDDGKYKFDVIEEPINDQWPYQAVANVILAHSLIRSFTEVDPDRTAITGISWGGYLTCIVAGLDNRFKAAVPVYGCGFLHEHSIWMEWNGLLGRLGKMSQKNRDKWVRLFDPSRYVGFTSTPMFFINGTNDIAYPLDSYEKTYQLVKSPRNFRITVNMKHDHLEGWIPEEIRVFVDEYLKDGIGLPVVKDLRLSNGDVYVYVKTQTKITALELHYTTGTEEIQNRKWQTVPGSVEGKNIRVPAPPEDSTLWFVTVTDERGMVVSSELVFAPQSRTVCRTDQRDYHFDGTISRKVLENYLSRAITMSGLYGRKDEWQESARMLKNIGAKFIGRSIFVWGGRIDNAHFEAGRQMAEMIHSVDPQIILQAGIFEIITTNVNDITIPQWVLAEFEQPAQPRNFRYKEMLSRQGRFVNLWSQGASVPDISRMETQMWYFYLAASYINAGIEAIHIGQIKLIAACDTNYIHTYQLLSRIRLYASKNARRHLVLFDSHVSSGIDCYGLGNDSPDSSLGAAIGDKLLFDFHALPLRIKEITDKPQKAKLQVGHLDSIYKRSRGGVTPSGWKCDHLPFLVEFDNWGSSGMPGQSVIGKVDHPGGVADVFWIWGYDEITWFAHQSESQRNAWLHYAWKWLRKTDPAGFLQMPGRRGFTNPINGVGTYRANTKSAACPQGFNQEQTIKAIWTQDKDGR